MNRLIRFRGPTYIYCDTKIKYCHSVVLASRDAAASQTTNLLGIPQEIPIFPTKVIYPHQEETSWLCNVMKRHNVFWRFTDVLRHWRVTVEVCIFVSFQKESCNLIHCNHWAFVYILQILRYLFGFLFYGFERMFFSCSNISSFEENQLNLS